MTQPLMTLLATAVSLELQRSAMNARWGAPMTDTMIRAQMHHAREAWATQGAR